MTSPALEIRPLEPSDDIEAELDLRRRAFGPIAPADRPSWIASLQHSINARALLGAFDGTRLVATARFHLMRQWWHGQVMPMAGVAGVKVAPEERGRGVGRALMTALLSEIAQRGYPVSALYPTTLPFYRALGWEVAGGCYEAVFPATSLTAFAPPDPCLDEPEAVRGAVATVRRAGAADAAAITETLDRVHQAMRHCGANVREPAELTDWLDDPDHFVYVADDGFLSYRWADGHSELRIAFAVAASAATGREFWQILASHATLAHTVRAIVPPDDPLTLLMPGRGPRIKNSWNWMLRLVDPAEAIARRGYPDSVGISVPFELIDEAIPANAGRWRLEVAGGTGKLARDDAGGRAQAMTRIGARGFAALFGGVPTATLRQAGLLASGDAVTDDALDAAFAGRAFMLDSF